MKLGSYFLILLLAWNTVDDLCVLACTFSKQSAPLSDDEMYPISLVERGKLVRILLDAPCQGLANQSFLSFPAAEEWHGSRAQEFSFSLAGSKLLFLQMSVQC